MSNDEMKQQMEGAQFAAKQHLATVEAQAACIASLRAELAAAPAPILSGEVAEFDLAKMLRKAYNFGQTYWQQADSEYLSQQKKSNETAGKFADFVTESVAALDALAAVPAMPATADKLTECRHCGFFVALNRAPADAMPAQVQQPSDDGEALDILDSLIENIKKGGNYSAEATLTFLGQVRQCIATPSPEAAQVLAGSVPGDLYPTFNHPDDSAVDRFAAAMKSKMAASRAKGRSGWDNEALCLVERLQAMLCDHVAKGDPVDVGNFAMMLFNRGERTAPAAPLPPVAPQALTDADIEWSHDLQARLISGGQNIAESEDARHVMAEAACFLAAITGQADKAEGASE